MSWHPADFLEFWIDANVRETKPDWARAMILAQKLRSDAANEGYTIADLGLDDSEAEKHIIGGMVPHDY